MKKILLIIMMVIMLIMMLSCSKEYSTTDINEYQSYVNEVLYANSHMPTVEDFGCYENVCIARKTPQDYFFSTTDSISVFLKYSEENYYKMREKITKRYTFLSKNVEYLTDYNAEVNGYFIKIIEKEQSFSAGTVYYYPNTFLMVGFNDESNTIVFLYHYDSELDRIENLDEFLEKRYNWNFDTSKKTSNNH